MGLTTTTIGSYPKPDYRRIPEFVPKHQDPTHRYSEYLASISDEDRQRLERATRENVQHQVAAGIDIPTDGETPRSHYVHYHLRHLGGVDFVNLSEKVSVLPRVPMRQWVVSFPWLLRLVFAARPQWLTRVLGIVTRALSSAVIRWAGLGPGRGAQTGIVTFI